MLEVIFNPDSFFRKEREQKFQRCLVVIVISVVLSSINGYVVADSYSDAVYRQVSSKVPADQAIIIAKTAYTASIISPSVVVIISWIVISVVLYIISAFFSGKGSFSDTLKLTAYSLIPSIVLFPVNFYLSIENARLVESYGFEALKSGNTAVASAILGLAVLIWQFTLWKFGIMHARNLNRRDATITAAIPAVVLGAVSIYSLINLQNLTL